MCYNLIGGFLRHVCVKISSDLQRFLDAQANVYDSVIAELKAGRKRTHWMWFIFPQAVGLGESEASRYYSIMSLKHASRYADHPTLGKRLVECTEITNSRKDNSAESIFGWTDAMKFRSSLTLFSITCPEVNAFRTALDIFYDGYPDNMTLRIVDAWRR